MTSNSDQRETLQRTGKTVPLYAQIAQLMRQRVYLGEFRVGDTLPSESALMAEYGVSQSTVRKAMGLLQLEDLIVTVHGVGSQVKSVPARLEVAGRPDDRIESRMPTPAERRDLGIAQGVPVLVLVHPDGREEIFDAMRTVNTLNG